MRNKNFTNRGSIPSISDTNSADQKEVQNFNNKQVYSKGFSFATQAANNNEYPIVLNGNARQIHGICLYVENTFENNADLVSLTINNEVVLNNVVWWNYCPQSNGFGNAFKGSYFFPLRRALSGQDDIQLNWTSVNAHKIFPVFFISNSVQQAEH